MKYQVKYVDVLGTQAVELPEGSIVIDADLLFKHEAPIADSRTWYQKLSDFLQGGGYLPIYKHCYMVWHITYLEPIKE